MSALLAELTRLGETRQADLSVQTYKIYAEELMEFELCDLRHVLRRLAREPKPSYAKAFPDLGTLIESTKQAYAERTRPKPWVSCGECINGFVYVDEEGNPWKPTGTSRRVMRECECKLAWKAARDAARLDRSAV